MNEYLRATPLLNYKDAGLRAATRAMGLPADEKGRVLALYNFVRDTIRFGYNLDDAIPASRVLLDGYGQCNTKGILFMALLRAVGIPCRIHGFTIDKKLQRGAMTGLVYRMAPVEILHSWVEVLYKGEWLELEGFILDVGYLTALQDANRQCTGSFCGYGVATADLHNPQIYWEENNTCIQKEGIVQDLGVYPTPDAFFAAHAQTLSPAKRLLYRHAGRHLMNRNIRKIRKG